MRATRCTTGLLLCIVAMGWMCSGAKALADEPCKGPHNHQSPASPEALKKLLDAHEAWIKAVRAKSDQLNLCGIVLTKLDLKGVDLRDALLRDADLTGADLTRANLERADLSGAVLLAANLHEADVAEATLVHADLSKANLKRAKLTGAVLIDITATETIFTDADLRRRTFEQQIRSIGIAALQLEIPADAVEGQTLISEVAKVQ